MRVRSSNASIAEGIPAELEATTRPTTAETLAALMTPGLVGRHLHTALWRHFANATRADVFLGTALAAPAIQASLILAELDATIAEAHMAVAA